MRLAFLATLSVFVFSTAALAQSARTAAPPVLLASHSARTQASRASARLFSRVEVGITSAWPSGETEFADYAVQEIEAGTVSGDLYVRWSAFGPHARQFTAEVATAGQPFTSVATVVAAGLSDEYGVHVLGLAPGLYEVRMREAGSDGTVVVSTPVRVRV